MTEERNKLFRSAIFDEIEVERKRQDGMWGNEFDDKNTPNDWVTFITRYVSKAAEWNKVLPEDTNHPYRTEMLKAAAICVAALEAYDRAQETVRRHYE